jgi:hypothetical protein
MNRIVFAFSLFLVAAPAFAQQDKGDRTPDGKKVKYEVNTLIDYDTRIITGHTDKPLGVIGIARTPGKWNDMILERADFKGELLTSVGAQPKAPTLTAPK